jgi:transcriptional regulator with XRE-family HTH domain
MRVTLHQSREAVVSNIYGEWLKARRTEAGLTQAQLAEAAIMTRSHIAHIEAGRRVPSKDDARRLDRALGTGDVLSSFLPGADDTTIADFFEPARALEQQAVEIREFASTLVPGLLQIEPYMRALFHAGNPRLTEEECAMHITSRQERQKILADPVSPEIWTLLHESALRQPVGGPAVMAEQLRHIIALVERRRIRLHVLPIGLGAHPLMEGMAKLMWFSDQPPAVYTEGLFIGKLHDSPTQVQRLQYVYDLALGDALPCKESLALTKSIAEEHEQCVRAHDRERVDGPGLA